MWEEGIRRKGRGKEQERIIVEKDKIPSIFSSVQYIWSVMKAERGLFRG